MKTISVEDFKNFEIRAYKNHPPQTRGMMTLARTIGNNSKHYLSEDGYGNDCYNKIYSYVYYPGLYYPGYEESAPYGYEWVTYYDWEEFTYWVFEGGYGNLYAYSSEEEKWDTESRADQFGAPWRSEQKLPEYEGGMDGMIDHFNTLIEGHILGEELGSTILPIQYDPNLSGGKLEHSPDGGRKILLGDDSNVRILTEEVYHAVEEDREKNHNPEDPSSPRGQQHNGNDEMSALLFQNGIDYELPDDFRTPVAELDRAIRKANGDMSKVKDKKWKAVEDEFRKSSRYKDMSFNKNEFNPKNYIEFSNRYKSLKKGWKEMTGKRQVKFRKLVPKPKF